MFKYPIRNVFAKANSIKEKDQSEQRKLLSAALQSDHRSTERTHPKTSLPKRAQIQKAVNRRNNLLKTDQNEFRICIKI